MIDHQNPGLICTELSHTAVYVQDPEGRHRIFKTRHAGLRFAANMRGASAWTVCVRVNGVEYVVLPNWVTESELAAVELLAQQEASCATILLFPLRGRFAEQAASL